MAHLTDMEELLATIESSLIQDYMREAMNCYMASAYRGCIVLSYIALFDDLYDKLGELGKVNRIAKTIYTEVTKKKHDQEVFEKYLIDNLASNNLLSKLDSIFLDTLRTLRNKSAHPSGHKPSSEEARFIFFEVIDRFLSRPILSTTQLAENIVSRLVNGNFFVDNIITNIAQIVNEEIKLLDDNAIPFLIHRLLDKVLSTDSYEAKNSNHFLHGLAQLDKPIANTVIQSRILNDKSDDEKYTSLILGLISTNGKLILGLSVVCLNRIKRLLVHQMEEMRFSSHLTNLSHPVHIISSLANNLNEEELFSKFHNEINMIIDKFSYSSHLLQPFSRHPRLLEQYINSILENAGSQDFSAANSVADMLEKNDEALAHFLTPQQSYKLLLAIDNSANIGAYSSQRIRNREFSDLPIIKQKAIAFYNENNEKATEIVMSKYETDEIKIAKFVAYFEAQKISSS